MRQYATINDYSEQQRVCHGENRVKCRHGQQQYQRPAVLLSQSTDTANCSGLDFLARDRIIKTHYSKCATDTYHDIDLLVCAGVHRFAPDQLPTATNWRSTDALT